MCFFGLEDLQGVYNSNSDLAWILTALLDALWFDKWLSYRKETVLQGGLVMAKSGRLEPGYNIYLFKFWTLCILSHPLGGLGTMYDIYLRLIRKPVVDFLTDN